MKTITLGEVLTDEQVDKVMKILDHAKSDAARINSLKNYYTGLRKQLAQKGVLPEYLAYVTLYVWRKNSSAGQEQPLKNN